jgi:hypothetical protein
VRTPLLIAAALAALALPAAAQVVDGQLLERGTERPVEGAAVELLVGGSAVARAATDTAGRFTIALEDAGSYRLSVRRVGYAPATSQSFPVEKGDTTHVMVRLVAGTVLLAPVRAVADARRLPPTLVGFYDRVETSHSGRFITRDRIDQHAAMRTTDLLRTLAGIQITQNRRGGTGVRRRGCEPAVYVDGVYVTPQGMSLDDLVRPHDLEGVEVYSASSLPPAFVRQRVTGCGAVLFWTRIEN